MARGRQRGVPEEQEGVSPHPRPGAAEEQPAPGNPSRSRWRRKRFPARWPSRRWGYSPCRGSGPWHGVPGSAETAIPRVASPPRQLVDANGATAALTPAHRQHPCGGRACRRGPGLGRRRGLEAGEPECRRVGVLPPRREPRSRRGVLPPVLQHVDQGMPHLRRCPQGARVVARGENRPSCAHEAIQALGHADGKGLHASSKRQPVLRLDDQMNVVRLNRELDDPSDGIVLDRRPQRQLDDRETPPTAQLPRRAAASASSHGAGIRAGPRAADGGSPRREWPAAPDAACAGPFWPGGDGSEKSELRHN